MTKPPNMQTIPPRKLRLAGIFSCYSTTLLRCIILAKKLVDDNSCNIISQNEYISKYDTFVKRYEITKCKQDKLQNQRKARLAKHDLIGGFMFELMERDEVIAEFDERLFGMVVERVVVREDGLELEFKWHLPSFQV